VTPIAASGDLVGLPVLLASGVRIEVITIPMLSNGFIFILLLGRVGFRQFR